MTATFGDGAGGGGGSGAPASTTSGATRFADYFAVVGLDLSSGLEPDTLSGDNLHVAPLSRPYKCAVLGHHPESVSGNPFDAKSVALLCCPRGLSFTTDRVYSPSVCPKPQDKDSTSFHTFLVTREDGSRIYGAALTFYEEVRERSICAAMQTLHAMHLAELANTQSKTLYYNIDPFTERTPPPTLGRRSRRPSGADAPAVAASAAGSITAAAAPTPPPVANLIVRDVETDLYDVGKLLGHLEDSLIEYDAKIDKLFVTKTICLITQLPFFNASRAILEQVHAATMAEKPPKLPIEAYIYNALFEVPLPPPGRSIKFFSVSKPIFCQRPSAAELPLFDFSFAQLFSLLGMENLVQVFTCACLETQILLHSVDYQKLMHVAEGVSALLFPFSWQHVYVPILPASLHHFLDAPVPFIMGLKAVRKGDDLSDGDGDGSGFLQDLPQEASMCYVDIDRQRVTIPEDLPEFPDQKQFLREIQEAFQQFNVPIKLSVCESENNNLRQTLNVGPRPRNDNDDSEEHSRCSPHHPNHHSNLQNSQYSSSSSTSSTSGHHHPHLQTSRLSSKSTNDLKTHQFSSTSSSALLGVDENHPQGSWPPTLPDDQSRDRYGRPDETDSPDYSSSSLQDSQSGDSSSCCNNESGSPSPRMISTSSLASSRQSSSSQLQHQQQQQNKNRQRLEVLEKSEAMARITAIVKRTGVLTDFDLDKNKLIKDLSYPEGLHDARDDLQEAPPPLRRKGIISSDWPKEQLHELRVNNAVRQIFFNRFAHLFRTYENFVIHPGNDDSVKDFDTWLSNREMMQNFDKTAFLSDQPAQVLPFLSRFIETQMFTTLIDNKIKSQWIQADPQSKLTPEPALIIFDTRIKMVRELLGEEQIRASQYEPCTCILETELLIEKRADVIDHVAPKPRVLPWMERGGVETVSGDEITEVPVHDARHEIGFFPILNPEAFNLSQSSSYDGIPNDSPYHHAFGHHHKPKRRDSAKWRRKDRQLQHSEHLQLTLDQREKYVTEARSGGPRDHIKYTAQNPKLSDLSPAVIAQTNWKFVETLLKEAKAKTKRMLVAKMGHEAVELGHGDVSLTGVEENTLIVALCDLLERIWSHGLQTKQGKSALWSHLLAFQEMRRSAGEDQASFLAADISGGLHLVGDGNNSADGAANSSNRQGRRQRSPRHSKATPLPSPAGYPPPHRSCASAPGSAHSSPATDKPPYSLTAGGFYGTSANGSRDGNGQPDNHQRGSISGAYHHHRNASPSTVLTSGTSTTPRNSRRTRASSRSASSDVFGWRPLPNSLEADMLNVQGMTEIRTEIGFARAWVRLALEKKLLSSHLKALLSSSVPLPNLDGGFGGYGRASISAASSSPFAFSPSGTSRSRVGEEGGASRLRGGEEGGGGR